MNGLLSKLENWKPHPGEPVVQHAPVDPAQDAARSEAILRDVSRMYAEQANAAINNEIGDVLTQVMGNEVEAEVLRALGTEQTRLVYAKDWKCFRQFCLDEGLQAKPALAPTIAYFLLHRLATRGSTALRLNRYYQAIAFVHRNSELSLAADDSLIRAVLRRAKRFEKEAVEEAHALVAEEARRAGANARSHYSNGNGAPPQPEKGDHDNG
jgi:hypothetical protein